MKKITVVLIGALMFAGAGLFAGSLDTLTNQSAKLVMTTSRNASTDGADIVYYNPAGTAWLSKGLHIDVSGQSLFKYYRNNDVRVGDFSGPAIPLSPLLSRSAETLKQDQWTPILPNLHLAYNLGKAGPGKLAAYMQASVVAGGGELKYKNGTAGTTLLLTGLSAAAGGAAGNIDSQEFNASSVYFGIGAGVSYAFPGDKVSVSFGGRAVMAKRSFDLTAAYGASQSLNGKYEYGATGFTPIIGVNFKPNRDLTLAARFEAPTSLEFKYEQKELGGTAPLVNYATAALKNAGIEDGKKTRQDLPAVIGLGAGYRINDKWTVDLSGTLFLLSRADLGNVYENGDEVDKINNYFGTGYEVAFGATYKVRESLSLGAGTMYSKSSMKEKYLNDPRTALNASANPVLDSISLGTGATQAVRCNLDLTLSFLWSYYMPENFSLDSGAFKVSGRYTKKVFIVGYGVSYKF